MRSRTSASSYSFFGCDVCACTAGASATSTRTAVLPKLRIDFLEVAAIDEHLSRLAAGAW